MKKLFPRRNTAANRHESLPEETSKPGDTLDRIISAKEDVSVFTFKIVIKSFYL